MSFTFDERETREPLGSRPLRKRRLIESLTQSISSALSSSTSSNYFTDKFGSNHRVIYEGVAKIISEVALDVMELSDDSSYQNLRSEFILNKLSILLYDAELAPEYSTDKEFLSILLSTLDALLSGSTEASIKRALESLNHAGEIELRQTGEHTISVLSSLYSMTSISEGHRHFVLNDGRGLSSTQSPLGAKWGDDLHQHDIIDGVIQAYTDSEGVSHTHEMTLGLSPEIFKLQANLTKVFETTRPAHVVSDYVSSVIGETISLPSESSLVDVDNPDVSLDPSVLSFSLGSAFQENMRKARVGTFESLIYAYVEGKTIRAFDTKLDISDRVSVEGSQKKVFSVEAINLVGLDSPVSWSAPRLGASGTGVISELGYFTADAGNNTLRYLGEGELILIEGEAFFVHRRAPDIIFPKATKVTLESSTGLTADLYEVSLLDYQWESRAWSYRTIEMIAPVESNTQVLRFPIRKTYKGLPVINADIISEDGYEVLEYRAISNQVVLDAVIPRGQKLTFRVPYGEGDKFNFLSLNSSDFTLNSFRKRGQAENLSGRNRTSSFISARGESYGNNAVSHLYSSQSISPKTTEIKTLKTYAKGENTLNNVSHVLGRGFRLNSYTSPLPVPLSRVTDFAVGTARVYEGFISNAHLGFTPREVISVSIEGEEVSYSFRSNRIYVEATEGALATVTAISVTPLNSSQTWSKSSDTLSEGQVPFVNQKTHDPLAVESSPSDIMSNPLGLKIDSDDQLRSKVISSTKTSSGTSGEEVFYEDNVLSFNLSGASYFQYIPALTDEPKSLKGGFVLNSSSSRLGRSSALQRSLGTSLRFSLESPRTFEDNVPLISDEVTTFTKVSINNQSDIIPNITEDLNTTYTMLAFSHDETIPLVSETLDTSLFLTPSTIQESLPVISDDVSLAFAYSALSISDTLPNLADLFTLGQIANESDVVPVLNEEVNLAVAQGSSLDDIIPNISEALTTSLLLSDSNISDSIPLISDVATYVIGANPLGDVVPSLTEEIATQLNVLPTSVEETIPLVSDAISTSYLYTPVLLDDSITTISEGIDFNYNSGAGDTIPAISEAFSYAQTHFVADSVPLAQDGTSISLVSSSDQNENVPVVSDNLSFSLNFSASETIPVSSDDVTTSLFLTPSTIAESIALISEQTSYTHTLIPSDTIPLVSEAISTTYNVDGANLSDTIPLISENVATSLSLISSAVSDTLPEITEIIDTSLVISNTYSDLVPVISEDTSTNLTLVISDNIPNVTYVTSEDLSLAPNLVSDTIPNIVEDVVTDLSVAPTSISDIVPDITESVVASYSLNSVEIDDLVPVASEVVSAELILGDVSVSDTIPLVSEAISTELTLPRRYLFDLVPVASDDVTTSFGFSPIVESDTLSALSESLETTLTLILNEESVTISEDTTASLTYTPVDESDVIPNVSEVASISQSASASDSVPSASEEATTSFSYEPVSESDTLPSVSDEATGDFLLDTFDLFGAITNNGYSVSDSERFIVYTKGDYFATGGAGEETLFSSFPTPTFYADSGANTALGLDPNRRGFIRTLIQSPPYTNTTPPSANVSWRVQNNSFVQGEWLPNIDYEIFVRTTSDDTEVDPDLLMAFQYGAVGANSQTVMGATPTYNSFYPQGDLTTRYYKHTISVDGSGNVTFTQDTVAKSPAFAFATSVRVFFFIQNLDYGLGEGAFYNSSVHITNTFGNTIYPTIHEGTEVTSQLGIATVNKTTINNTDNNAQFSYQLTCRKCLQDYTR